MVEYLKVKSLSLQTADKSLCQNLNFSLKAGETWGVLGGNGSGKTSLLHALAGIHPGGQKSVYLKDKPLCQLSSKWIAQHIGLLFQDQQSPFPQTVFDYALAGRYPHLSALSWEKDQDRVITDKALAQLELLALKQRNVQTLSGGERRRLDIATLLIQAPLVYLLDEPTNHLDLRHQFLVMQHFHTLAKQEGAATIMALHDVNLAQKYCDYIIMLFDQGEVILGEKSVVLSEENLARLYQHPLYAINFQNQRIFVTGN